MLKNTLESPLDSKEIKPVNPKGSQPWISIERTDAETEAPILWPLIKKANSLEKTPDAGKDWRWEEKGTVADEMVGWHPRLDGHEFELEETVKDRQAWCAVVHGVAKSWTRLSNWTATTLFLLVSSERLIIPISQIRNKVNATNSMTYTTHYSFLCSGRKTYKCLLGGI